ncbi:MAG: endonuclease domain-containing protein [Planctomycetia bacterium]|nr:endonuclease domain-containing protein [Planctomycetia bacterium]
MTRYFNREGEKEKRRVLRSTMPPAEVILWQRIRGQQLGYKFRRQFSVGSYVIDFYCAHEKLAIELDGESHFIEGASERDKNRQEFIENFGIRFLRFTNVDIYDNIDSVLQIILKTLTSGSPSYQGGARGG